MRLLTGSMRYQDASRRAHAYPSNPDEAKFAPTCLYCAFKVLQPLHVDDRSGVHFLICPVCGEVFYRPQWYETNEERTIRLLLERISELEARVTALETQMQTREPQRTPPKREEDESSIMLPNLFTV